MDERSYLSLAGAARQPENRCPSENYQFATHRLADSLWFLPRRENKPAIVPTAVGSRSVQTAGRATGETDG